MTTLLKSIKTCGCCGKKTMVLEFGSTCSIGSRDLDLRPPQMQRSAMFRCLQFCKLCGYAAWDLEEKIRPSDELKAILSEKISTCDRLFERAARIAELNGRKKADVRHLYLVAAWAADDRKDAARATAMRRKVLSHVSPKCRYSPGRLLQFADIARRAGETETAAALLKRLERRALEPSMERIAEFQKKLLAAGDTACYTMDQACDRPGDLE